MNFLTVVLIVNSIGILIIYLSYRFFSWLLIERDPILYPAINDRSTNKNNKLAKEDAKNQNNFALTEILNSAQISNKTTQNEPIIDDVSTYNNKKIVL